MQVLKAIIQMFLYLLSCKVSRKIGIKLKESFKMF